MFIYTFFPGKSISYILLTFSENDVYWSVMNREIVIETVDFSKRPAFTRHGGAYDRGSADSWFGREPRPHYFTGATYESTMIEEVDMSEEELEAYTQGYNESPFQQKEW